VANNSVENEGTQASAGEGIMIKAKSVHNYAAKNIQKLSESIQCRSSCFPFIRRIFGIGNRKLRAHTGIINICIG
jgi:hypothetical protein